MNFYNKYKKYKQKYINLKGSSILGQGSTGLVSEYDENRVIKKSHIEDGRIINEILNYDNLQEYQGILVPRIYKDLCTATQLVIDKVDIDIYSKLKLLPIEDKKILINKILNVINRLNDLNICHNDLKFENMGLSKNMEPLLIDLEDLTYDGKCIKDNFFKHLLDLLLDNLNKDKDKYDNYNDLLDKMEEYGSEIYDDHFNLYRQYKNPHTSHTPHTLHTPHTSHTPHTPHTPHTTINKKPKIDLDLEDDSDSSSSSSSSDEEEEPICPYCEKTFILDKVGDNSDKAWDNLEEHIKKCTKKPKEDVMSLY